MNKFELFAIILAVGIFGFRIYQKYFKDGKGKTGADAKSPSGSVLSSSKDDDYEPYLKK